MRLPRYEGYLQPDDDWLGEIPGHWNVRRTKTMFTLRKTKVGKTSADYTLLSLTLGGVIVRDMDEGGKFPAEFDTYQIVESGDLVFCLFDIDETPRTIGIAHNDGMITGAYSVYRALPSCIPEYACYYFLHLDSFKGLRPFYTGLRKVVRADTFAKVAMPAPPLDEQKQIAAFLDYETAKIDALIEKQQKLIVLLGEKRQAVISHAVTKGLNPDAPMRDSGIEWLGEVPAHWTTCKFSHAVRYQEGPGIMAADFHDAGVPLIRIVGVRDRWVSLDGCNYLDPQRVATKWAHFRLQIGDLVISASASMGTVSEVGDDAVGAVPYTGLIRLVPLPKTSVKSFVRSLVVSDVFMKQIDVLKAGATIQHFGPTHLRQIRIAVPPIEEQSVIAEHVDKVGSEIEDLVAKADEVVLLLQERRTALISAAVTGKIDVRGWKPPSSEVDLDTEMEVA